MSLVTLNNDFHGTEVTIRCEVLSHIWHTATIYPSARQIKRAKRELCGVEGCACSDDAGCRGRQEFNGKRLVVDTSDAFGPPPLLCQDRREAQYRMLRI